MLTVKGKVTKITEEKTLNNGARAGKYILQELEPENEQYPQKYLVDVYANEDRLKFWDKEFPKDGDIVEVEIKFDVREYNGKYFSSSKAWRTNILEGSTTGEPQPEHIGEDDAPF